MSTGSNHLAELIWSVADLLRGDFKRHEYGKIILPLTVLRRLECVLAPTRDKVADAYEAGEQRELFLRQAAGHSFYNISRYTLKEIAGDPKHVAGRLTRYVTTFSTNVREVLEKYDFAHQIKRLDDAEILYQIVSKFADLDLRPEVVPNQQMGYVFEDLIRRFPGVSAETTGEHVTPREVIELMVNLLIVPDADLLQESGVVRTVYDPACGTGGMLSTAEEHITAFNPGSTIKVSGQEINPETWAICRSNLMIKGQVPDNIAFGNSFTEDGHLRETFDYMLCNPPFGVDWKKIKDEIEADSEGKFRAGLPRTNDGSLLFLQHMISKMKAPAIGGSRIAIVLNKSPLFTGIAGSGESEIRRWILENDWLEAIVALPDQLFYHTGISTYFWILTNRKTPDHQGKVILLDARDHWQRMRRSLGDKRKEIGKDQIKEITCLYGEALTVADDPDHPLHGKVKVFRNEDFGYRRITVEHPLKLRFELTEETLEAIRHSAKLGVHIDTEKLADALRLRIGTTSTTKDKVFASMRKAVGTAGLQWPSKALFLDTLRDLIGVRDTQGEVQYKNKKIEPDPELRDYANVPLSEDVEEYLKREIHPRSPDAWIDHPKTKIGYEISPMLFFHTELNCTFEPLSRFVQIEARRISRPLRDGEAKITDRPRYLRAQDLYQTDSAADLPDSPTEGPVLTPCTGGDLVGRPGNWRLLPADFGEAATLMFVLRPLRGNGRALCEWLNLRNDVGQFSHARDLMNLPVPVDLVADEAVDNFLEEVQEARRTLRESISGILPNVFASSETDVRRKRNEIRYAAYEAQLISELVRPLDDPIWRAEWSYPYHVAALARRYRISTHPAERKDSLLKLGEGIARMLGLLALSDLIVEKGFSRSLRDQFYRGATFGTWLSMMGRFLDEVSSPRLQELVRLHEGDNSPRVLLDAIRNFRNDSHHAHGVRTNHELNEEVEKLEPYVLSALSSVSWLSGAHWDWVERCEYLDESSYKLVGLRLRGSHPSWEPFERPSTFPLKPERIYIDSTPSGTPVDLWPLAAVSVCPECRSRELFLLNQVQDGLLTLRSLEEHSLQIPETGVWS
ncbi:SAM-dependent DNA methyltransferase [Microbispora sp. RL4-1S]|uniref:site-specific DNA-methyltransferase (adenine-specific) n=2 Tax=Microbispora oryzae TaxID=2806554 RepID=A0A940WU08_9ACTN|nr:SAM-dependent DNA methyltransferase [Microbispora oryzae]